MISCISFHSHLFHCNSYKLFKQIHIFAGRYRFNVLQSIKAATWQLYFHFIKVNLSCVQVSGNLYCTCGVSKFYWCNPKNSYNHQKNLVSVIPYSRLFYASIRELVKCRCLSILHNIHTWVHLNCLFSHWRNFKS